ncbi:MAG: hypothetical protein EP330_22995 [Deltaproteobacteria bacterium]|nr:MAG: hypothetical protein EP330_22995 [Deltaproteobacteria bacterium]
MIRFLPLLAAMLTCACHPETCAGVVHELGEDEAPLGFTPREVLEVVEGSHALAGEWMALGTPTEVALDVVRLDGPRLVESACGDGVEQWVDVDVRAEGVRIHANVDARTESLAGRWSTVLVEGLRTTFEEGPHERLYLYADAGGLWGEIRVFQEHPVVEEGEVLLRFEQAPE